MLVLVDDHSRFISVRFLTHKSEALTEIRSYVAELNALVNSTLAEPRQIVGTLHTDNAGEFLSREFGELLDEQLIAQTTCPPHVHSLNGVAERAIRAIVENMRSTMVAGNVPVTFWNYIATHSADVLNRTGGPPGSTSTAYEILTGAKPKVLGIWPIGCRAYPVRPRSASSKTLLDPHGWIGINLGEVPSVTSGYYVWLTKLHRVAIVSDVWFDETLMPWRPTGDQRVGAPPPHRAVNDGQPPGLPATTRPSAPTRPASTAVTLGEAYDHAVLSPAANARASTLVLLLFSGPKNRPDGLATFLHKLGYTSELVDNDPVDGGGAREDLLDDAGGVGAHLDGDLVRVDDGHDLVEGHGVADGLLHAGDRALRDAVAHARHVHRVRRERARGPEPREQRAQALAEHVGAAACSNSVAAATRREVQRGRRCLGLLGILGDHAGVVATASTAAQARGDRMDRRL